ncbi:MAG TPA: hypothetical protein V6C52_11465 [Coleofasciculaceae cyanobacterium]|jgi:hypothetical protein
MDLGSAASIGIGLIKHKDEIGGALGGVAGLGKLGGKGFAAIAEQFHLSKKLTGQISQALEEQSNPKNLSSLQALSYLHYFDANGNGEVTKEELQQGMKQLESSGLGNNGMYQKLHGMGEMLLKNYDKAAQLDGNAGSISYQDLGKLVNLDKRVATLSEADWQKLNA